VDGVVAELRAAGAVVEEHVSLAPATTIRVGGPARLLVTVGDERTLAGALRTAAAAGLPWFVLGRGSNLIVPDAGWPGMALRLDGRLRTIEVEDATVRAGAAAPLPTVALRAAEAGLGGFAWGVAVPGSVGGAVRMNAGAHGADMADALVSVRVLRIRAAEAEDVPVDRLGLRYRGSDVPDDAVVTGAVLRLAAADATVVRAEMDEIRAWRREHQPLHGATCGSVFTNPPGGSAGRLIEEAGLKGHRVGGATVSPTHANFIETTMDARADDVLRLIDEVRTAVARRTGVELAVEVVVLGASAR
jgi:UDP-N-acetylmuramate dehydrogenase